MALSFSKTGSAIGGVAKTIFPGLIVSVIGASFGFLVFNNPEKIRGKATLRAWESLKQYEKLYIDNTDEINCGNVGEGVDRFKSDMIHQIQMTSENLKNILEKEGNVDNLMLAIINMKIDSYNEMKKQTEIFLDTLKSIDEISITTEAAAEKEQITSRWIQTYSKYTYECAYLKNRDTATINKILNEISKTYSIKFSPEKNLPALNELRQKLIGNWSVALFKVSFGLNEDSTGYWNAYDQSFKCTWKIDSTTVKLTTADQGTMEFTIERLTPDKLVLNQAGGEFKNNTFLACRIKE
jgi:hypothetical protein